jgi:hypothetical protein
VDPARVDSRLHNTAAHPRHEAGPLHVLLADTDALQFSEILAVINNFRVSCYTTTKLDTAECNAKALVMLERCNRICVTKLKHKTNEAPVEPTAPDKVLALCLHAPYTQSVVIAQTIQTASTDAELDQFNSSSTVSRATPSRRNSSTFSSTRSGTSTATTRSRP